MLNILIKSSLLLVINLLYLQLFNINNNSLYRKGVKAKYFHNLS